MTSQQERLVSCCRMVSGQVVGRGELSNDGSAVGLCFRMNVEAAMVG